METTDFIISQIIEVSKQLNWYYILSFNLISGILTKEWLMFPKYITETILNEEKEKNNIIEFFIEIPKGIRVLLLSIPYTYIYIWMFEIDEKEQLFVSFLFSVFFHGILYKSLRKILTNDYER